ncbi:MAG: A24 family peptidase [Solobacterium sp.]|nr:A24 family peptidase [Solobacterium sp.]
MNLQKNGIYRSMNTTAWKITLLLCWILSVRGLLSYPEYRNRFLHPGREDAAVLAFSALVCLGQYALCRTLTVRTILTVPVLAASSWQDLKWREIPDLCHVLIIFLNLRSVRAEGIYTALFIYAVLSLFSRKGMMGAGDVKLIAAFSLSAGTRVCTATACAALLVLIAAAIKKDPPERQIPFAPFLTAGFILVLFLEAAG